MIRTENGTFTTQASKINEQIRAALEPIFQDCLKNGIDRTEFMYLAVTMLNEIDLWSLL